MSKPVYGKNSNQSRKIDEVSGPVWVLAAAFVLFLGWTPFQVGLFNGMMVEFEKPIYMSALLCGLMLLVWAGLQYKNFKLTEQTDLLVSAAIFLPIIYALSLFVAVSHYMAMTMLFIQSVYAAVFIISFYLLKSKKINHAIQMAIMTISYAVVGFGLFNWFGFWKFTGSLVGWFTDAVLNGKYSDAVMTDSNGLRLTSVFQYANTYAAFLMAFLFIAVFALTRSRKWYGRLTHGFMLVPIIVSIMLTLSRGGLVMLPVVFILLLLFLKSAQQILWIMQLGIAGIAALLITTPVSNLGIELNTAFSASSALKGWGYLLGASVIVAGLSWIIQHFAAPWLQDKLGGVEGRKLNGLWIPLGSVALVIFAAFLLIGTGVRTLLPDNIETRLENINFQQHSVLERITFYKDALKVVKDYPILGAGGGGWGSLYEHYQNNPYISRQVHNFFLQYLIEVGIIGFIAFMTFILYIFYKYIRRYMKRDKDDFQNGFFYLIIALSILVHSLLDFNMSYAFMGILVFIGLAGMAVVMDSKPLRRNWNRTGIRVGYFAMLVVGTLFLLFLSISYIGSSDAAYKAKKLLGVSQSYEEIKAPLIAALKNRPGHPESVLYLSSIDQQVFSQTKDEQYLTESYSVLTTALKNEPYNKNLLRQLAAYYDLKGEGDQAYAVYRDNADKFIWDIEWYDTLINRSFILGEQAYVQKDDAAKERYFNTGLAAYNHVVAGIEHLKTLPPQQMQGREFNITPTIAMNAGKIKLMLGDAEAAASILKQGLSDDYTDLNNREIARWYLAALAKNSEKDEKVYNQLIAAEPTEAARIDEIAASQYKN